MKLKVADMDGVGRLNVPAHWTVEPLEDGGWCAHDGETVFSIWSRAVEAPSPEAFNERVRSDVAALNKPKVAREARLERLDDGKVLLVHNVGIYPTDRWPMYVATWLHYTLVEEPDIPVMHLQLAMPRGIDEELLVHFHELAINLFVGAVPGEIDKPIPYVPLEAPSALERISPGCVLPWRQIFCHEFIRIEIPPDWTSEPDGDRWACDAPNDRATLWVDYRFTRTNREVDAELADMIEEVRRKYHDRRADYEQRPTPLPTTIHYRRPTEKNWIHAWMRYIAQPDGVLMVGVQLVVPKDEPGGEELAARFDKSLGRMLVGIAPRD